MLYALCRRLSAWSAVIAMVVPMAVTAQELEPNDPCPLAQNESALVLPIELAGSLDSSESLADVDFFRFTAHPGEGIQVDLEGASSGAGTLADPYLGLFDENCLLVAVNDDGGGSLNSSLTFLVPPSGEFVLGVSYCCDQGFSGGGLGSYALTLGQVALAGSISGIIQDAASGLPLSGEGPPWAYVTLLRCNDLECYEQIATTQVDGSGGFAFSTAPDGAQLRTGTYQVQAYAQGYEAAYSAPFEVLEQQHFNIGVLQLSQIPVIGSVRGRLLDGLDASPLPGQAPPFAFAMLARCEEFGCYGIATTNPDENGFFEFDGSILLIPAGDYIVIGQAEGFYAAESATVSIGIEESVDLGDLVLQPIPIRFGEMHECVIAEGQVCRYGIDIGARVAKRFRGEAWSIVQFIPTSVPGGASSFQVGRLGATNPMPQQLNLKSGQMQNLTFELRIPTRVPDGYLICTSIVIGSLPDAQFNVVAERPLFCGYKQGDSLQLLSEKESRQALRRHSGN